MGRVLTVHTPVLISDDNIPEDADELTAQDLDFLLDRCIESITSNAEMVDPVFHISGGIKLKVHADTDIDPWVLGLLGITLLGKTGSK